MNSFIKNIIFLINTLIFFVLIVQRNVLDVIYFIFFTCEIHFAKINLK